MLYGSPPPRSARSSGVLGLAEHLSGRKASSVSVDGVLVDMDRVDLPISDGPPPQTPLTKKAKVSGGGLADMGQQAVSQLGSVPTSDPLCFRSLSPVFSPITGIGWSHLSSIPDTPSPLRKTIQGTTDPLISPQSDHEQNTNIYGPDPLSQCPPTPWFEHPAEDEEGVYPLIYPTADSCHFLIVQVGEGIAILQVRASSCWLAPVLTS